jgi:flagellar basal-body rod modification protein FlgD
MQVQSTDPSSVFAASTAPTSSATTTSGSSPAASTNPVSGSSSTPTESMFLQLLVAQLKYQDPTSPQDPTQFVGELAQFSQLEQTLGIRQDTDTMVKDMSAGVTTAPATTTPTATPTTTQSPAATQQLSS